MIITLTKPAFEFAERHEGEAALKARAEQEIEHWTGVYGSIEPDRLYIFSWHGIDNLVITRQGEIALVDMIEDDDGELEIPFDPTGGQEPDAVPLPSAKE